MPAKKVNIKKIITKANKTAFKKVVIEKKSAVKKSVVKTVAKKEVVKPVKKTVGLTANVYNTAGKVVSKFTLPKEIFGVKVNDKLMAQAVRVYLANQRSGTASTKTRGEVHGTTKKAWRQKGTGRARHGSRKAPIFVHGGVAFGPRPHDFSLKFPQKMRRSALFSALTFKNNEGTITVVSGLEKLESKTKSMAGFLKKLGKKDKNMNLLLITPDKEKNGFENVYRSARNIQGLRVIKADLLNTYEILNNKGVIIMKDSIDAIEKHFVKGEAN